MPPYRNLGPTLWEGYKNGAISLGDLNEQQKKDLFQYTVSEGKIDVKDFTLKARRDFDLDNAKKPLEQQSFIDTSLINYSEGDSQMTSPSFNEPVIQEPIQVPSYRPSAQPMNIEMPQTTPTITNINYGRTPTERSPILSAINNFFAGSQNPNVPRVDSFATAPTSTPTFKNTQPVMQPITTPRYDVKGNVDLQALSQQNQFNKVAMANFNNGTQKLNTINDNPIVDYVDRANEEAQQNKQNYIDKQLVEFDNMVSTGDAKGIEDCFGVDGELILNDKKAHDQARKDASQHEDYILNRWNINKRNSEQSGKVGKFMSRLQQTGASTVMGEEVPEHLRPSTGNNVADTVASGVGGLGGLFTPAAGIGTASDNMYSAVGKTVRPISQKAEMAIGNKIFPKVVGEFGEKAIEKLSLEKLIDMSSMHGVKKAAYKALYKGVPSSIHGASTLATIEAFEQMKDDVHITPEKVKEIGKAGLTGAIMDTAFTFAGAGIKSISNKFKMDKINNLSINRFDKQEMLDQGYDKIGSGVWGKRSVIDGKIVLDDIIYEGVLYKGEIIPVHSLSNKQLKEIKSTRQNTVTSFKVGTSNIPDIEMNLEKLGYKPTENPNVFVHPETKDIKILAVKEGNKYVPYSQAKNQMDIEIASIEASEGVKINRKAPHVEITSPATEGYKLAREKDQYLKMFSKKFTEKGYKEVNNGVWVKETNGTIADVVFEYASDRKGDILPIFKLEGNLLKYNQSKGMRKVVGFLESTKQKLLKNMGIEGKVKGVLGDEMYDITGYSPKYKTELRVNTIEKAYKENPKIVNNFYENVLKLEALPNAVTEKIFADQKVLSALESIGSQYSGTIIKGMNQLATSIHELVPEIKEVTQNDLQRLQEWNKSLTLGEISQIDIENAPTIALENFMQDASHVEMEEKQALYTAVEDELYTRTGHRIDYEKDYAPYEQAINDTIAI
ncbi:hypothetical protein [Marinisporobacter balticus]|uniref:Uncharacterized protein n=1 Tax=Marinisporobacter balticus TaxID=2018667 RepID=A0A4R2L5G4_9FIRM|nr:hypothetical protein [Marinisporobacter balticus]TCO79136.1 hypothetical protein EV214_103188 [Marinisporobacter balticus]